MGRVCLRVLRYVLLIERQVAISFNHRYCVNIDSAELRSDGRENMYR
jgi:hypothetical protein